MPSHSKRPMQRATTAPTHTLQARRTGARAARVYALGCALITALTLWSASVAAETPDLTPRQHELIRSAKQAQHEGAYTRAHSLLDEALAIHPHPYVYRHLGALALSQGRCAEAKALLGKAHLPRSLPYGRDYDEDERRDLLRAIAGGCPAQLELTCPAGATAALDNAPIACNTTVEVRPGQHILTARFGDGRKALPRRIVTDGEALTTLRLDRDTPEDASAPVAGRWVPTSQQPLPVQDPLGERYASDMVLNWVSIGLGTVFVGLGATGLALAYNDGDPADNPDPSLSEDEQWDRENAYNAAVAYSWMSVGIGVFMYGLTWALWPDAPPPSDTPGFSEPAPRVTVTPWLDRDGFGGGLGVTF